MSLSLGIAARVGHGRFVPTKSDETDELRLWGRALRLLRKRADLTQDQAAEAYAELINEKDFTAQAWGLIEAGKRKYLFSPVSQRALASAIGATIEELAETKRSLEGGHPERLQLAEAGASWRPPAAAEAPPMALLPIRDRVQAGAWLAVDDHIQVRPKTWPALRDPRFPNADQWLSEVVGDSVNRLNIFEGDLVQCVDAIGIGYFPRTGDIVEVERLRFGGQERELTLKELEVTEDGVRLWPRSTNPRWQEPLSLTDGAGEREDIEVRIRALVITVIRRLAS